jgi:eukaryotic-like serine/threonine-protein kinase
MDDFTDRSQFRIGDLLVIPGRLIVMRDGQEIKLEPRWMEVLVMLAEHAGETLSTERLLIEVWGSTVYGDSPVSKTISCIRKNIGDDRRKPRYVETVSKVGYRLIAQVSLPEDYRRMPSERWTKGSPYVGLSAFGADHASVFCGRSRIVADLLKAMRVQIENQRRFVLIVGASGCGKTSLLRAGAIPLLTKPDGFDGLRALSVTTCDLAANGSDPLAPLTAALGAWTLGARPVFPPQTPEQLKALLTETPNMIEGFVSEAFRRHSERDLAEQPYAHLLLTVDHAETLVATTDIDAGARDAFARVMQALCACPHVMVTMIARGDFYLKLIEALPALAELKAGDGHLDVMAPRYGEIGEIIRSPAWKADLSFETDPETRTRLDDALRDAALSQPDALPLLQHTLQTLYERRNNQQQLTFAAYNDIGGLEGAVAHRAEEVFSALPANARASLDIVLAELIVIQPDSDAVSGRRTSIDAFDADARTLIDAFTAARLFVRDHHNGQSTLSVVHEALLRRWPRAVEWTKDNRRLLQARARLQLASARWVEEGRQDDHLLNPGRPLAEALEIANSKLNDLVGEERDFVDASALIFNRKLRMRRAAITGLTLLTLTAIAMALIAQAARERADTRRAETQDIINYTIRELVQKIEPTGNIEQLESISEKAISHYKNQPFDEMRPSDFINYSRSLRILGRVRNDQRMLAEAKSLYAASANKAAQAIAIENENSDAWFELSQAIFYLGEIEFHSRNYVKADNKWSSYLRISRKFNSVFQNSEQWLLEESYALNNLGSSSLRQDKPDVALNYFRKSEVIKRKILGLKNDNLDYRYEWIDTCSWISSALEAKGDLNAAARGYDTAIDDLRMLTRERKNSNTWKLRLANYLMLSAKIERSLGNHEKSTKRATESVRIMQRLTALEPENSDWKNDLNVSLNILKGTKATLQ